NIVCNNSSRCDNCSVSNRYTWKYCNIGSKPYVLSDMNRMKDHSSSKSRIFHMVNGCKNCIVSDQCTISDIYSSLILKYTSCIDEYIFPYMNVSPTVCIKWRKHSKTVIDLMTGQF